MKKMVPHNFKNQQGQALVMGIALLLFASICSLFLLSYVEKAQRLTLITAGARREALGEHMKTAHLLNQLSFNNRHILASLALAENAYTEAADLGIYLAVSKPFTEARSLTDSAKLEPEMQGLFNAYTMRVARGLRMAQALSLKNKNIVEQLDQQNPGMLNDFSVTSPETTWCMAIYVAHKNHPVNIPVLDTLVNNLLTGGKFEYQGCNLNRVSRTLVASSTLILPFDIISRARKSGNPLYGVTYVSPTKSAAHFTSLLLKRSKNRFNSQKNQATDTAILGENAATKLTQVHDYTNLVLTNGARSGLKAGLPTSPFHFSTAVVHPNLRTRKSCNASASVQKPLCGTLLVAEDYVNLRESDFEPHEFLSAFFKPHWTSLIADQEKSL